MGFGSFNIEFNGLLPVLSGNGAVTGRFQFSDQVALTDLPVCGLVWPIFGYNNITPGGRTNAHGALGSVILDPVSGFVTLTDIKGQVFIKSLPAIYFTGANGGPFYFAPRVLDYSRCWIEYPAGSTEDTVLALNEFITLITLK